MSPTQALVAEVVAVLCDCLDMEPGEEINAYCNFGSDESVETCLTGWLSPLAARIEALEGAWSWLAENVGLELDWAEIEEGEAAWRVHRVSGGRSDREWTLIATGVTPLAAVQAARSKMEKGAPQP